MAATEILNYIKTTTKQGFTEEQIKTALLKAGWQESEVNEAFLEMRAAADRAEASQPAQPTTSPSQQPEPREATEPEPVTQGQTIEPTTQPLEPQAEPVSMTEQVSGPSFFQRYKWPIIIFGGILLALIIALVIALIFSETPNQNQNNEQTDNSTQTQNTPGTPQNSLPPVNNPSTSDRQPVSTDRAARERDEKRLADIEATQQALSAYFAANDSYPQSLLRLVTEDFLGTVPEDPETGETYLYTPLGSPATHYAISFILETNIGTLDAGLQVVTSDGEISVDEITEQEELIRGASTFNVSEELLITDLKQATFFPRQEVTIEVQTTDPEKRLTQVFLSIGSLRLSDENEPFQLRFSAPAEPGTHRVNIIAFGATGETFSQTTNLEVVAPE